MMNLLNPETTSISSSRKQGQFKLIWRMSLALFTSCLVLSLMYLSIDLVVSSLHASICLLSLFSLFYLMKYKKSKPIFWLFAIFTSGIVIGVLHTMPHVLHYEDFLWIACIILFAFIGLEYKYALAFVLIHSVSLTTFFMFELNTNIASIEPQTTYQLMTFAIESGFALAVLTFFIFQFVLFQNSSKHEVEQLQMHYKSVVDNMNDALVRDNREGRFIFWNDKFLEMFGYTNEDMLNLEITDIIDHDYHESLRAKHVLRTEGLIKEEQFEYHGIRKDGSNIWIEINVTPLNKNGIIIGTQSVIRDITFRKEQELELLKINEELIQIEETERQRIASELHDSLNQMIIAAKLYADMPFSQSRQNQVIEILDKALSESRSISNNLMPKDLYEFGLKETVFKLAKRIEGTGSLKVRFECDELITETMLSDHIQFNIYRVIQECINNTIKHSGADFITIKIGIKEDKLSVFFMNNGKAIENKILEGKNCMIALKRRINILKGSFNILENSDGLVMFAFVIPHEIQNLSKAG